MLLSAADQEPAILQKKNPISLIPDRPRMPSLPVLPVRQKGWLWKVYEAVRLILIPRMRNHCVHISGI